MEQVIQKLEWLVRKLPQLQLTATTAYVCHRLTALSQPQLSKNSMMARGSFAIGV